MPWLLDSHAVLWALFDPKQLGARARAILEEPANTVLVSPVSYWEISLKYGLAKLKLPSTDPEEIPEGLCEMGIQESPLASRILTTYHRLPQHPDHRDPFDRLLIWEAIRHRYTFLSRDRNLDFYRPHGLKFEW